MKYVSISFLFVLISHVVCGQNFTEIAGRPTDSSITINILFDVSAEVYYEYGNSPGVYNLQSNTYAAATNVPLEIDLRSLTADTKYYYRMRYRPVGSIGAFAFSAEHNFHTQRPRGKSFTFVIEADPHLDNNTDSAAYRVTLKHMLTKRPDFMIDLGDNFMTDKLTVINQSTITERHVLFRSFYNELCHSAPLYLVLGNHEGEYSWVSTAGNNTMPVMATNTRKLYYPNPYPNSFYSGNNTNENLVGLRENYYSWEWGDALFIVLDPYWYTTTKSVWGWTLGTAQYNWLKEVISSTTAKFKFVFCHQLVSGNGIEGRGGSESVPLYEMGGNNTDGTYGFSTNRPGWDKPIHTLLKDNNCTIFFHGHDHLFAKQDLDNIVYQEVPQPSAKNITVITGTEPGYGYANGLLLPNRGYLLVIVSPDSVKVDYVRTYLPSEENATRHNGDIAYSYTIKKSNGVPVIDNQELVNIFPNPAFSELNIQYKTIVSKKQCRLINSLGKVVLTASGDKMNVSGLSGGAYILDIETDTFRVSKKIIISH